jgi:hypothetical protein
MNHHNKERLFATLDKHTEQNEELIRGVYGDKKNEVKGLLERMALVEKWIMEQKFNQVRLAGGISALTAIVVCGAKMVWDIIVAHINSK